MHLQTSKVNFVENTDNMLKLQLLGTEGTREDLKIFAVANY